MTRLLFLFLQVALMLTVGAQSVDRVKPAVENKVKIAFEPADFRETSYEGWIADRMQINIEKRLLHLEMDSLLKPFVHRPGVQW